MKNLIAFVLFSTLLIACSKQTDIDPALQVKSSGLFTYTIIPEGDGKVTFRADSTQIIKEYLWDFGDGTTPTTTTIGTVSHTFTKNMSFQVKLTAKNSNNQVVDTKGVIVNSRLARSFDDLPQDQRNKLRVLHIIVGTRNGINPQYNIENFSIKTYLNDIYQNFIKHHSISHQAELNSISFQHYFLRLSSQDSIYLANHTSMFQYIGNPVRKFLDGNVESDSQLKDIFNKSLNAKRDIGASIVVFWVPFDLGGGVSAYAQAIGSYTTIASILPTNLNIVDKKGILDKKLQMRQELTLLAHEMGHNLGMPHDSVNNGNGFIMNGVETKRKFDDYTNKYFAIFQSKDYDTPQIGILIDDFTTTGQPYKNNYFIQEDYFTPNLFNQTLAFNTAKLKGIMNSGGSTFFPALESHLIEQFNIKLAPSKVTSFEKQIPRNARISANSHLQTNPIE